MTQNRWRALLRARFSLQTDKADNAEIERRIREGVELKGATPWILMFAIFVASIGLNVNSTAVIIGAMLISPLMGPIMGIGHGLAVYDFDLVKKSFSNLAIATVISLLVSALYFLVTPLADAQSELLARTSPNLWDVLIAFVGGLAGIVGATRAERSNVIPGVAIATALMPPLCTAGYGLGTGQWGYFAGAIYLYAINCVFIAVATITGLRLLHFPHHSLVDDAVARKLRVALWVTALVTALPAAYLGAGLVKDELFRNAANRFVYREFVFPNVYIASAKVDPAERSIDVSLIGEPLTPEQLQQIESRLAVNGMPGASIRVHQAKEGSKLDLSALKASLLSDLYKESQEAQRQKDVEIAQLRQDLQRKGQGLALADDLAAELRVQLPGFKEVLISQGYRYAGSGERQPLTHLTLLLDQALPEAEKARLLAWLKLRLKSEAVHLSIEAPAPVKASQTKRR